MQIYLEILKNKRVKIFNLPEQSNWYHIYRSGTHILSIHEHYDDLLNLYEYQMQLGSRPVFTFHLDNQKDTKVFKAVHELNMVCVSKFNTQQQPIMQRLLCVIKSVFKQK